MLELYLNAFSVAWLYFPVALLCFYARSSNNVQFSIALRLKSYIFIYRFRSLLVHGNIISIHSWISVYCKKRFVWTNLVFLELQSICLLIQDKLYWVLRGLALAVHGKWTHIKTAASWFVHMESLEPYRSVNYFVY